MEIDSYSVGEVYSERPKNDVFLNYLFKDVGKSFVSHLKGGLSRNAFTIFDHTMLPIGQDKSFELLKAIEESEIYLVVFSLNYPFSTACLDELVLVMDTLPKFKKRKVFPIFFNVDPSHVRSQRVGSFMDAFNEHESNDLDPDRVQKWRQVLKDVGNLSGQTFQNGADEAEFEWKVIKDLEKIQSPQDLHVADHHVGIDSRAQELISKLRLDFRGVLVVAVFGISGIGKTTIVKAVYNKISTEFDVSCFLADIHSHSGGQNWKVDLPKLLISCLARDDRFPVMHRHNDGVTNIIKFIRGRKILLVLDHVENIRQLEALGINPKWFNNGSRIIVTTRDKHSLGNIPYTSYHMTLLNRRESLDLFTRLMFAREHVMNNKFVEEVVSRAGGLPLVLKVWSSHFTHYKEVQWPSILETLKKIPHGDVQKQLQMSYNSLSNREKKLFLDIACFFDRWMRDYVVHILQDEKSGFFLDNEIQCLINKSLVEIDAVGRVLMHNAIREMCKEVVRQENEDDPGKRTRLMDNDVVRVLRDCSGTESVEGIVLEDSYMKESVTLKVEGLKKMINLRYIRLILNDQRLSWSSGSKDGMSSFKKKSKTRLFHWRGFKRCWSSSFSSNEEVSYFSFKNLKYLEWPRFPFECINIDMENVVVIKLQESKLEILWEGFKSLKNLKILDVSYSSSLTKTGDFAGLEKLEQLRFHKCNNLKELHSSFSCLEKLVVLDLGGCRKLKRFPWEMIGKLRSLKELHLEDCRHTGLERVEVIDPSLSSLKKSCITRLNLGGCNISKISHEVGNLKSLKYLNLERNRFRSLPDSLCQLHELEEIYLSNCPNITSIPNLPSNIVRVTARDCKSSVNLPSNMSELQFLRELNLNGCFKLETEGLMKVTGLRNLNNLSMRNCNVSHISSEIGNLVSLEELDLSKNTFSSIPDSFSNLSKLRFFKINMCSKLELLPLLPSKLLSIEAKGCESLNINLIQKSFFTGELKMHLSGREIPKWCSCTSNGDELSFVAPKLQQHLHNKICGVIICATTEFSYYRWPAPTMLNKTKETSTILGDMGYSDCSMVVRFYSLNNTTIDVEPGDTLHLQMNEEVEDGFSFRLSLVYEGDTLERDSYCFLIPLPTSSSSSSSGSITFC